MEDFVHEPEKWHQKPKITGKLELIGKEGFSFRYLWPIIEWNQLKYPIHQNLCYTVLLISYSLVLVYFNELSSIDEKSVIDLL